LWISTTQEQYATELLRLRSCLNNSYNIAKQLSEDSKLDCQDRLAALQSMLDSRLSMVQLLMDVDMLRKVQPNQMSTNILDISEQDSDDIPTTFKRVHS
jgi:hypothetical protein